MNLQTQPLKISTHINVGTNDPAKCKQSGNVDPNRREQKLVDGYCVLICHTTFRKILYHIGKKLFTDKNYVTDTVSANKNYVTDTVKTG